MEGDVRAGPPGRHRQGDADRVRARGTEVVIEAFYGWYWAVDAPQDMGGQVHLAHPLGVRAFEYRRVKNDQRDARDLADLLRMGRLPETLDRSTGHSGAAGACAAPGQAGRDPQKLQGAGPRGAAQVRYPGVDDRTGRRGRHRITGPGCHCRSPNAALRRIITTLDFESDAFAGKVRNPVGPRRWVRRSPGHARSRLGPGRDLRRRDRRRAPVRPGPKASDMGPSRAVV